MISELFILITSCLDLVPVGALCSVQPSGSGNADGAEGGLWVDFSIAQHRARFCVNDLGNAVKEEYFKQDVSQSG